jgi:hypothetical protein
MKRRKLVGREEGTWRPRAKRCCVGSNEYGENCRTLVKLCPALVDKLGTVFCEEGELVGLLISARMCTMAPAIVKNGTDPSEKSDAALRPDQLTIRQGTPLAALLSQAGTAITLEKGGKLPLHFLAKVDCTLVDTFQVRVEMLGGGCSKTTLELSASTTIADVKASVQRQEGIRPEHLEVFSLEGMSPLPECAQVLGPCTLIARVDTSENLVHYILAKMFTTKESDIGLPAFNESHQLIGFYCEKATEHGASSVFKLPFHFAELRPNAARILNRHLLVNIHKRSKSVHSLSNYARTESPLARMKEDSAMYHWTKVVLQEVASNAADQAAAVALTLQA